MVIILLLGLISFRTKLFPTQMLGTPTQVHVGTPDSEKRIIRVGGDEAYPPFSFLENGEARGFDNDLMRAVANVMGVELEFNLSSWDEAKQNLLDGKVDVIGGMAYSTDRDVLYDFSTPHTELYFDLFIRKNSDIDDIRDIEGKQIIIQSGGIMDEYLQGIGFPVTIIRVDTPLEALKLLASGKYDGALLNLMQGYYFINQYHLSNLKTVGEYLEQRPYGFAVANNETLLRELNQALAIVKTTGVYDQINKNWFNLYRRESFLDQARYYLYAGAGLVAFSLIVVSWLWALRRTVRRRTRELKVSEEKYRQLIQNAAEGVIVISDANIVYINPIGCEILGIPESENYKLFHLNDIVQQEDLEQARHKYARALKNGENTVLVTLKILKNGSEYRWMKVSLVRLEWEQKPSVLCFFTDITEEKLAEDKIRASEERYRLLFTKSPVGLFYYDETLKITSVNEIMARIMRSSHDKLEGFNLNHISDARVLPALRAVLDHEEGYYEGPFKPMGTIVKSDLYISLHTTPLVNENHEYKGGIAQIEDITEKVRSEHKIQRLEERFSKAFYTSPDSININRLSDGVYLDCNRSFIELTGYTRDEIIGKSSLALNIWANPEDRDRLVKGLRENGEVKNLEADFRVKNGRLLTGLMSASVIDVDGEKCILSVTRDISDIKKAQIEIRESEERYRTIFDTVPVSIWEQDFQTVYDMLEVVKTSGVTDLASYLDSHPGFVEKAVRTVIVKDMNEESLEIFKAKSKGELFSSIDVMFREESYASFRNQLLAIWDKKPIYTGETINQTLDGQPIVVNVTYRIPEKREDFAHILVSISDTTARKEAEEQARMQLQHLAALRAVDMAISASMDLQIVLRVLAEPGTAATQSPFCFDFIIQPGNSKIGVRGRFRV